MSLLPENVHAKTRFVVERVTAIAGAAGQIIVDQAPISLHQRERDLLGLIRSQRVDRRIDKDRLQFAEIFHLQRMADGKIEIGNAVIGLQHRGQNFIEIGNSHRSVILRYHRRRGSFRNGAEFLFVDRLVVGFFGRNPRVPQMFHDRVVERLVAFFLAHLNHAGDLVGLAFANEVRDRHVDDENFQRGDAARVCRCV